MATSAGDAIGNACTACLSAPVNRAKSLEYESVEKSCTVATEQGANFTARQDGYCFPRSSVQADLSIDIAWRIFAVEACSLNGNAIVFLKLRDPADNLVERLLL